jgi:hypothetical protein
VLRLSRSDGDPISWESIFVFSGSCLAIRNASEVPARRSADSVDRLQKRRLRATNGLSIDRRGPSAKALVLLPWPWPYHMSLNSPIWPLLGLGLAFPGHPWVLSTKRCPVAASASPSPAHMSWQLGSGSNTNGLAGDFLPQGPTSGGQWRNTAHAKPKRGQRQMQMHVALFVITSLALCLFGYGVRGEAPLQTPKGLGPSSRYT